MNNAINNQLNYAISAPTKKGSLASLKAIKEKLVSTFSIWGNRVQQRHELATLSDHILRDIGISRIDAKIEARKPFWQE